LDDKELPEAVHFYDDLHEVSIEPDEYTKVRELWETIPEPRSMWSLMELYNIEDVRGFVEAVEKMRTNWIKEGFCMITGAISISGMASQTMFRDLDAFTFFWLPTVKEADICEMITRGVVGGK
jgi:hypothetical protein